MILSYHHLICSNLPPPLIPGSAHNRLFWYVNGWKPEIVYLEIWNIHQVAQYLARPDPNKSLEPLSLRDTCCSEQGRGDSPGEAYINYKAWWRHGDVMLELKLNYAVCVQLLSKLFTSHQFSQRWDSIASTSWWWCYLRVRNLVSCSTSSTTSWWW